MLLAIIQQLGANAQKAVPLLHVALKDRAGAVREAAANALGRIGPEAKQVLPTLVLLLQDEDRLVREAADAAIKRIDTA